MSGPFWSRIVRTFVEGGTGEIRILMMAIGARVMSEHSLVGVGYQQFPMVAAQFEPALDMYASHNTWIEAGAGAGLPGLALWLGAYIVFTIRVRRLRKNPNVPPVDAGLVSLCFVFMLFWWFRSMFFTHLGDKVLLPLVGGMTGYLTSLSRTYLPSATSATAPGLMRPVSGSMGPPDPVASLPPDAGLRVGTVGPNLGVQGRGWQR